jgi:aspartyl-tRNA(Asn)/glutamyl-tRNA(Gln) amidotransferase subunit B
MEQGSLRVEPNPSVRLVGSEKFGVKTELKNLNSFRSVQRGIEYEKARQSELLERGETVIQATYGWDDEKGVTVLQRLKEAEQEYRYFPEPDLIPIDFLPEYIEEMRRSLPELPLARKKRFVEQYSLPEKDAAQLIVDKATADFYEEAAKGVKDPKVASNWLLGDLARLANAAGKPIYSTPITPASLAGLIKLIDAGTITGKIAKELIEEMFSTGNTADDLVKEKGIQVSGADEVAGIVARIVAANMDVVAKIKAGADKSKGFLVGQIMKEAKGRARPDDVNRLLEEELAKVSE